MTTLDPIQQTLLEGSQALARASSRAPVTTRRISRILLHFAASASSFQEAGRVGMTRKCTLSSPSLNGRARQASSAVKHRMGASQAVRQENTS